MEVDYIERIADGGAPLEESNLVTLETRIKLGERLSIPESFVAIRLDRSSRKPGLEIALQNTRRKLGVVRKSSISVMTRDFVSRTTRSRCDLQIS
ncbi:hypothetical protein EL22_27225 [Halostagnicola sp. A56]|nr:hypothetical protein EL22_27225 [Halostagnicola sp. A56]